MIGSLADWTSRLSPLLGRVETLALIQSQYDRLMPSMSIAYVGMLLLAFSLADQDPAMHSGVIARTIVLDLPETIAVRERLLPENGAISQIARSVMEDWGGELTGSDAPALVIIEGLTMYLSEADAKRIFAVISGRFERASVLVEIMNPLVAKRVKETSIEGSHAKFTWGIKNGKALAERLPDFRLVEEHSLTEGRAEFVPVYKLLGKIPAIRNISNKIVVLEK